MELLKLRNVLKEAGKFPWKLSLFLPKDEVWTLDSTCFLLDLDELEDDVDEPDFDTQNGFKYTLNMQDVQDIIENALSQRSNCSDYSLFVAFLFYYDNDAFIEFEDLR